MDARQAGIRAGLLATPGAVLCPWCAVITQGGHAGLLAHTRACHPERGGGAGL